MQGRAVPGRYGAKRAHGTALALLLLVLPVAADAGITFVSWGGAYTRSQMLAYVRPFEQSTGTEVEVLDYNGGLAEIRAQVRSLNVRWDVVDLEAADVVRGCEEGLLLPIDPAALAPAPDGGPAAADFIEGGLLECGVGTTAWATVIAYDPRDLAPPPTTLAAFFDLQRYPGKRGLRRTPKANLEWALLVDGVPPERVYPVLETEAGLQRAFSVLDRIKPRVVWWRSGSEAVRLLETDRVAMTTAYNGRIYDAVERRGEPYRIVWDRQIWNVNFLSIPRGTRRKQQALRFLRFATATAQLAAQADHIPYGPVRRSALARVPDTMAGQLPTAPQNREQGFRLDHDWWAQHYERLARRFEEWLERPVQVPRDLPH